MTVAASNLGLPAAGSKSFSPVGVPAELVVPPSSSSLPLVVGAGPPQQDSHTTTLHYVQAYTGRIE